MTSKLLVSLSLCATLALVGCLDNSKSTDPQPDSNTGGNSTDTTPPTVSASLKTGTYTGAQSVALTCDDGGGSGCKSIYYTADGSTPGANSTVFGGAIGVNVGVTTLKFIAVDVAGNVSAIGSETYTVNGANPGPVDKTPPSTSASPKGGTYNAAQNVTLTCSDTESGCKAIYYTTNGTTPRVGSSQYTNPISISAGTISIQFIAVDNADNVSAVVTETYTINVSAPDTTPPTVSASPKGGTYTAAQNVTLACSDTGSGCKSIHYTTNGSTPTTGSAAYTNPIAIGAGTLSIKFIAVDNADNVSAVVTESYTVNIATPDTTPPTVSAAPKGGTYTSAQSVALACDDGAGSGCKAIHYTTNGSTPTANSTAYTNPVAIGAGTTTLKFIAIDNANNSSAVVTETYTVNITVPDTTPPTVSASPPGGAYTSAQSVTLTCNDGAGSGCKSIHYTTDGATPTANSTAYTAPIQVANGTTTLKFIAVDNANNTSAVVTETYTIDGGTAGPGFTTNIRAGSTDTRIAVDGAGVWHTVYTAIGNTSVVVYGECRSNCVADTSWTFVELVARPAIIDSARIIAASGGRVHVIFESRTTDGTTYSYATCETACTSVGNWSGVDIPQLKDYWYSKPQHGSNSMVVDSSGRVYFLVNPPRSGSTMSLATCASNCIHAASWEVGLLNTPGHAGFSALAVQGSKLHMMLERPDIAGVARSIVYRTCDANCINEANWQESAPLFGTYYGSPFSMAVTPQGRILFSYNPGASGLVQPPQGGPPERRLLFFVCDANCMSANSWQGLIIGDIGEGAGWVSMATVADSVVLATSDTATLVARVCAADCANPNTSWQIEEVDSASLLASIGNATQIAKQVGACVDKNGNYVDALYATFGIGDPVVAVASDGSALFAHKPSLTATCVGGSVGTAPVGSRLIFYP
jgi:hypothetical protein